MSCFRIVIPAFWTNVGFGNSDLQAPKRVEHMLFTKLFFKVLKEAISSIILLASGRIRSHDGFVAFQITGICRPIIGSF